MQFPLLHRQSPCVQIFKGLVYYDLLLCILPKLTFILRVFISNKSLSFVVHFSKQNMEFHNQTNTSTANRLQRKIKARGIKKDLTFWLYRNRRTLQRWCSSTFPTSTTGGSEIFQTTILKSFQYHYKKKCLREQSTYAM